LGIGDGRTSSVVSDMARKSPAIRAAFRRHARRFQIVWWPLPRGMMAPPVVRVGVLPFLHQRQRRTQTLVLDNLPRLHGLDPLVNAALERLSPSFRQMYSPIGRPSIPPEQLLRALLLLAFFSLGWRGIWHRLPGILD
jgi:hypothetical protein